MYVHKQAPNLNSGACREKLCALITNVVHYVMVSYTRKKYVRELLLVECGHKPRRCHSYTVELLLHNRFCPYLQTVTTG